MTDGTKALLDVVAERQRQVSVEDWTPDHDDQQKNGELACAAACYAEHASWRRTFPIVSAPRDWPWERAWWKPSTPRRDLVKAAALILAEIERIDRAEAKA